MCWSYSLPVLFQSFHTFFTDHQDNAASRGVSTFRISALWNTLNHLQSSWTPARDMWNCARSIYNKSIILNDFFISQELDFLFLMETWLKAGELDAFADLSPEDCNYFNSPRLVGPRRRFYFLNVLKCRLLLNTSHFSCNYCEFNYISRWFIPLFIEHKI